jgi:hypothetical protein
MISCSLRTCPAKFADISELEKVLIPVSNASADRKIGRIQLLSVHVPSNVARTRP